MARPRKDQDYRLPAFHHGQKTFERSGPESATCPPNIVAAAVAVQDQWKQLQADWDSIQ